MQAIVRRPFIPIILACCFLCSPKFASAEHYAMVFSGGLDPSQNHDRYYDETLRMWNNLTKIWGYGVDDVYVLFADGTNPAVDRSSDVSTLLNNECFQSVVLAVGMMVGVESVIGRKLPR